MTSDYFRGDGDPAARRRQPLPPTVIGSPAPAVLINATMAATIWPDQEAIGRRIKLTSYDQDAPVVTSSSASSATRGRRGSTARSGRRSMSINGPIPAQQMVVRDEGRSAIRSASRRGARRGARDRSQSAGRAHPDDDGRGRRVGVQPALHHVPGRHVRGAGVRRCRWSDSTPSSRTRWRNARRRWASGSRSAPVPRSLLRLVLSEGLSLTGVGVVLGVVAAF